MLITHFFMFYRMLYPEVEINLSGLDSEIKYSFQLRFVNSDQLC